MAEVFPFVCIGLYTTSSAILSELLFALLTSLLTLGHYVDNNSTPTMFSNFLETKRVRTLRPCWWGATPSALLLCATIAVGLEAGLSLHVCTSRGLSMIGIAHPFLGVQKIAPSNI
jgi:hypothetical protein